MPVQEILLHVKVSFGQEVRSRETFEIDLWKLNRKLKKVLDLIVPAKHEVAVFFVWESKPGQPGLERHGGTLPETELRDKLGIALAPFLTECAKQNRNEYNEVLEAHLIFVEAPEVSSEPISPPSRFDRKNLVLGTNNGIHPLYASPQQEPRRLNC